MAAAGMEIALDNVATLAAGSCMLLLAAALWLIDPSNRLNRAFALFLVLRGALNVVGAFTAVPPARLPSAEAELAAAILPYFDIAVVFAAANFALAYHDRYHAKRRRSWPAPVLLAAALALEVAYALDHALYGVFPGGDFYGADATHGPLYAFGGLRNLSYALLAVAFLRAAERAPLAQTAQAFRLLGVAFALDPAQASASVIGGYAATALAGELASLAQLSVVLHVEGALYSLAMVPLAFAARILAREARERSSILARRANLALGALVVVGATLGFAMVMEVTAAPALYWFVGGIATLILPLLASYALVRHQLFDLDVKIKWTIGRGTLAGIFLAVFFVATRIAEIYLEQEGGLLVGGVTTGLLLFAIAPLQRFAERVANRALPDVKSVRQLETGERERVYAEQVRFAWADGSLDASERALLNRLRETLGLPLAVAARIELEAGPTAG